MVIDVYSLFCNFIGGFLLILAFFMAIAPWNSINVLFGTKNVKHGLYTGCALFLFLVAIVAFRRFDLYDVFVKT